MNMLSLTTSLTGIVFVVVGFIMLKFPLKKINRAYGYRTARSMKNQQQWDFAQAHAAREMMKLGALLALCSAPFFFININEAVAAVAGITLLLTTIFVMLFRVEKAIRTRFPNSPGN